MFEFTKEEIGHLYDQIKSYPLEIKTTIQFFNISTRSFSSTLNFEQIYTEKKFCSNHSPEYSFKLYITWLE